MVQDILTSIAILGASGYTVYSFVKMIINSKQKKAACSGCVGCSPKQSSHVFKFNQKLPVKNIL